jgi:hypothetical protein
VLAGSKDLMIIWNECLQGIELGNAIGEQICLPLGCIMHDIVTHLANFLIGHKLSVDWNGQGAECQ